MNNNRRTNNCGYNRLKVFEMPIYYSFNHARYILYQSPSKIHDLMIYLNKKI